MENIKSLEDDFYLFMKSFFLLSCANMCQMIVLAISKNFRVRCLKCETGFKVVNKKDNSTGNENTK